jgi:hypothetical protein
LWESVLARRHEHGAQDAVVACKRTDGIRPCCKRMPRRLRCSRPCRLRVLFALSRLAEVGLARYRLGPGAVVARLFADDRELRRLAYP